MIKVVTGREAQIEILPNVKKCVLHFLNFANINLTKAYLVSAWSAGAVGANHIYLVSIDAINLVALLNVRKVFDFKRLQIATSSMVSRLKLSDKRQLIQNHGLQTTRHIIIPNEFAREEGLYTAMYNVDNQGKLKLINVCTLSIPAIDLAHITRM